jgi:hypothetical protein
LSGALGGRYRTVVIQGLDCFCRVRVKDLCATRSTSYKQGLPFIDEQNGDRNVLANAKVDGTAKGAVGDLVPI